MSLKVYYDLMSQPSRALVLFLKANKIPYIDCPVALRKREHLTEEFAAVNPFKKVPAIDHDGFKLSESVAIVRYLANSFPIVDHWYPKDLKKRSRVDEYLEWQHHNTRAFGALYFRTKFMIPLMTNQPVNEKRVEHFATGLSDTLSNIENVFLTRSPFLGGDEISFADILAACELEQPLAIGFDIFSGHERLSEWMKNVQNQLNPEYDAAHKYIRLLKTKFTF